MKEDDNFIKAYYDFKKTVNLTEGGVLPDLDNLVWYMLMGVPHAPLTRMPRRIRR